MNVNEDEKLIIEDNTVYEIDDNCVKGVISSQECSRNNNVIKQIILALLFKGFYR